MSESKMGRGLQVPTAGGTCKHCGEAIYANSGHYCREVILDRLLGCVAPCLSAPNSGFNEVKLRQMFGKALKALTPSRQGEANRV